MRIWTLLVAVLPAAAATVGACTYNAPPVAGAPPDVVDSLAARTLSPRDITGSVTAWEDAYGDDSLFRPRVIALASHTIGITVARPAHLAVILVDRCGPYAAVPGRDLTQRSPAGDQWVPLRPAFRSTCPPNFWRATLVVIASELPLHGEVLEERARRAHRVEDVMEGRHDRWAAYAVYTQR